MQTVFDDAQSSNSFVGLHEEAKLEGSAGYTEEAQLHRQCSVKVAVLEPHDHQVPINTVDFSAVYLHSKPTGVVQPSNQTLRRTPTPFRCQGLSGQRIHVMHMDALWQQTECVWTLSWLAHHVPTMITSRQTPSVPTQHPCANHDDVQTNSVRSSRASMCQP